MSERKNVGPEKGGRTNKTYNLEIYIHSSWKKFQNLINKGTLIIRLYALEIFYKSINVGPMSISFQTKD